MENTDAITKLKRHYYDDLYGNVRKEWDEDQTYVDDTFEVPEIRDPHKIYHSGIGYKIVNSGAEQMVTSNLKVFFDMAKKSANEIAIRLSKESNYWVDVMRRRNPNPPKEFVKNMLHPGVGYIRLAHNETWVKDPKNKIGLPVLYSVPSSMNIYASYEEDDDGIPSQVMVMYERLPSDVLNRYPHWSNPKKAGIKDGGKTTKWFEYWDAKTRHCEADGEIVVREPNPYGFPPFIRRFSGFGKNSPTGDFADLIVGDIRHSRDLLRQECAMRSNITSIIGLFAHRGATIFAVGELPAVDIEYGEYIIRKFENLKSLGDIRIERDELQNVPPEMLAQWQAVLAEILQRYPFLMPSYPATSGRDRDLRNTAAMRRYDTVVENTNSAFATAIEKSFEICNKLPGMATPDFLKEGDLDAKFKCRVELRAPDPVGQDRLSNQGNRMVQMGQLSLRSNFVRYQGLTEDQADDEIDELLAERYMFQSPDIAELMQLRAAEKSGALEGMQEIKARRQELEKRIREFPLGAQFGSQGGELRTGNIKSPEGGEQAEYQRGIRTPPVESV